MTNAELTEYLKMAAELESTIYRQEEIINAANREMKSGKYSVYKEKVIEPTLNMPSPLLKPNPPKENGNEINREYIRKMEQKSNTVIRVFIGFGVVLSIIGIIGARKSGVLLSCLVIGAIFIISAFVSRSRILSPLYSQFNEYERKLTEYNTAVTNAQNDYEARRENYLKKDKAATEKYLAEKKVYDDRRSSAKAELERISQNIEELRNTLTTLYSLDIIFPKYRNMVAVSTIYEYFASGRCTELTGPNGAYNLYESELRQNIIIGKLDVIISQLEEIKMNQYMLYDELTRTNAELQTVSNKIDGLMETAKNIELNTYVTAQCSQITAKNTEAIKYLSLIR